MKEPVVISPLSDWTCRECQGSGELLVMEGPEPLCLACAELDHLVFLGRGDAAVTRRAKAARALVGLVAKVPRLRLPCALGAETLWPCSTYATRSTAIVGYRF